MIIKGPNSSKNISRQNESSSAPQIINSDTDRGSNVNASVLTATKEMFIRPYIQKLRNGTLTLQGITRLNTKRIIQSKTLQVL